jgi:excisionase family DNA binding protein
MTYIRRKAAAAYLGISQRTLGNWMRRSVVPFTRMSRRVVLFRPDDLDKAIDAHAGAVATDSSNNPNN